MKERANNNKNTIIVGGGVSGLYTAWRLLKNGQKVTLFEATEHVGGRLMTVSPENLLEGKYNGELLNPKNISPTHCELGGMRLPSQESYETYTLSLVDELSKELEKYKEKDNKADYLHLGLTKVDFPTDKPENWHYLRGFVQKTEDLNNKEKYGVYKDGYVPYKLEDQEKKLINSEDGMSGPMRNAIENDERPLIDKNQLPNNSDRKDALFQFVSNTLKRKIPIQGEQQDLYKFGFSDVINTSGNFNSPENGNISNQYFKLFTDAGGYDTVPASWNASTASSIVGLDFAGDPKYKTLAGGLRSIPATLEYLISKLDPSCIHRASAVQNITYTNDNYIVNVNGIVYNSDAVVLAVPPVVAKKLIGGKQGIFNNNEGIYKKEEIIKTVNQRLKQVTPIPLLKIYLMYELKNDKGWWENYVGKIDQYTRMTTDLPLRQIYNFGTYIHRYWMEGPQEKKYAVLQISYDDDLNPGYWAGLLSKESGGIIDTGIFGDAYTEIGQSSYAEVMPLIRNSFGTDNVKFQQNHPLFSTAHEQFKNFVQKVAESKGETIDLSNINLPEAGACMDWGVAPYGGGVNFWNVGVDVSKEYWNTMRPYHIEGVSEKFDNIYVVGEGYSIFQGWIEGALWTAEAVLENYFDLEKENWMPFNVNSANITEEKVSLQLEKTH
ncbi:FAD-dependent oxidoreductase [Tenacibaculum xiamenense]|uniref:FAD-dependent oxidoreductase n=1 Tax=Tenacibaculum xiamenense TaxID=1261553 RepID=UPI003894FC8E